jgi:hypothetical protein
MIKNKNNKGSSRFYNNRGWPHYLKKMMILQEKIIKIKIMIKILLIKH